METKDQEIFVYSDDPIEKPNDTVIARTGKRRLVKLVPLPGNYAGPAVWTSPDVIVDGGVQCLRVLVLMTRDPPQVVCITIPKDFYAKLPEVPVEW